MTSPSLRRKVVFLLLLSTFVAAPWAAAGPRRESSRAGKAAASLVFDFVSRVWTLLTGLQIKEGCHIDPSGGCTTGASPAPPPATVDEGCDIDPDGRCRS